MKEYKAGTMLRTSIGYKKVAAVMITLLFALMMIISARPVYAEDYSFSGECVFDGEKISTDYDQKSFSKALGQLEPGDTIDCAVTYRNDSSKKTEWYMRNSVLETLEESKTQAENGGYTYILKNTGPGGNTTTIFDNSGVGGDKKNGKPEGLKQATDATGNYFFIQDLKAGQKGKTTLHVEFEGETGVNDYMDTNGKIMLSYGVEIAGQDKTTESHGDTPQTGDPGNNTWLLIAINITALLLLIIGIIRWRKERKEGEADDE